MLPLRDNVADSELSARYRTMPARFKTTGKLFLYYGDMLVSFREKKKNDINDLQMELLNPYRQSSE